MLIRNCCHWQLNYGSMRTLNVKLIKKLNVLLIGACLCHQLISSSDYPLWSGKTGEANPRSLGLGCHGRQDVTALYNCGQQLC